MENQNSTQQDKKKGLASVRCFSLYENSTGAMQLSWLGDGFGTKYAMISIAPVFQEMVGKRASKGDRVYDYDHRVFVTLGIEEVIMLISAVNKLSFDERVIDRQLAEKKLVGDISIGLHNGDDIRIVRGTSVDTNSTDFSSIMMCLSKRQPGSNEPVIANFFFKSMAQEVLTDPKVILGDGESDVIKYEINPSFLAFTKWLNAALDFMVGGPEYIRSVNAKAAEFRQQQSQQNYGATANRGNRPFAGRQQSSQSFNDWKKDGSGPQAADFTDPVEDDLPF